MFMYFKRIWNRYVKNNYQLSCGCAYKLSLLLPSQKLHRSILCCYVVITLYQLSMLMYNNYTNY